MLRAIPAQGLPQRFLTVHFHVRLDAAGQYVANLEAFLRQLPFPKTLSIGELCHPLCPARAARGRPPHAEAIAQLRETVSRLEAQS